MEHGTLNTEHGTEAENLERIAPDRGAVPRSAFRVRRSSSRGFSLIELIVVVTIIGILAAVAIVNVRFAQRKAREAALKDNLFSMRKAIDNFYADKQRYPANLEELVPNYVRRIPADPITGKADWELVMDDPLDEDSTADTDPTALMAPGVVDIKSKGEGQTLDGVAYPEL